MEKSPSKKKKPSCWKNCSVTERTVVNLSTEKQELISDLTFEVCFRHAHQKDLSALEWEGEYTRFRNVYAQVFRNTEKGLAFIWVAELLSGGIIGQAMVQSNKIDNPEFADGKRSAFMHSIRIRPEYRRKGMGTCLIRRVEQDLLERGYSTITLTVAVINTSALILYQNMGYRIVSTEPGIWSYRDDKNVLQHIEEPSWRMIKTLK